MFTFGLTAEQVEERRAGHDAVGSSPALQQVLDTIGTGVFSPDERDRYRDLVADLTAGDWFMVTADFDAYAEAQRSVATAGATATPGGGRAC